MQGNKRVSFFISVLRLLNLRQSPSQSNESYYEQFLELVHAVKLLAGIKYFCNEKLMRPTGIKLETNTTAEGESEMVTIWFFTEGYYVLEAERMKAVMFLLRCDHQRYGDLL